MIGPQVQAAIYTALTGANVCEGRVYDQVPPEPVFPYLTIGDEQLIDDSDQCTDAADVIADIHAWSRPADGSKAEVKTIAAQAVAALKTIAAIAGFELVSVQHETTRVMRDPDGKTEHAVVTFRFVLTAG